jgi:hypothetical protein
VDAFRGTDAGSASRWRGTNRQELLGSHSRIHRTRLNPRSNAATTLMFPLRFRNGSSADPRFPIRTSVRDTTTKLEFSIDFPCLIVPDSDGEAVHVLIKATG